MAIRKISLGGDGALQKTQGSGCVIWPYPAFVYDMMDTLHHTENGGAGGDYLPAAAGNRLLRSAIKIGQF